MNTFTSVLNSTSTALGSSGTFTGTAESTTGYQSLTVAVLTNQDGTMYVDFSPDGVNWDSTLTYAISASANEVHRITIARQFFRVRYVNGSSAQSYMRLQTQMGPYTQLNSALNSIIQQDADAMVVRQSFDKFAITANLFQNTSVNAKAGKNSDIDTGTVPEDIWENGGTYTGFPSAAETVQVFSSSANDTAAGTGLRTLTISGLDASYNQISETVTLNGVTPVTTTSSFLRAHTAIISSAGSGGTSAGDITIRQSTTTANVFLFMLAGTGQTNCSAFTIPAGYTGFVTNLNIQIAQSTTAAYAEGHFRIAGFGAPFRARRPFIASNGYPADDLQGEYLRITEKSDMVIRITSVSNNNTIAIGRYYVYLFKN